VLPGPPAAMGRGREDDAGDDPEKWKELREKREKEKKAAQEKEENELREKRLKERRQENEKKDFKEGMQVMVLDLSGNNERNGSIGKLVEYIKSKDRWAVRFGNGAQNNFKIDNLEIQKAVEGAAGAEEEAEDDGEIPTAKVYITNLSAATKEQDLIGLFAGIGTIAKEPKRNAKGKTKGFADEWPFAVKLYKPGTDGGDALVTYMERGSARAAIKAFNGHTLKGSTIGVKYAGGGGSADDTKPRMRSRSRERIAQLEKDRLRELAAVSARIKDSVPISESKYFG